MTAIALGLSGGLISMAINVGIVDQMVKSAILPGCLIFRYIIPDLQGQGY